MTAQRRHPETTTPTPAADPVLERVLELVMYAYEGAHDAAELGRVDFSIIGEPLVEAIRILRTKRKRAA